MAIAEIEMKLDSKPFYAVLAELEKLLEDSPELWSELEEIDGWFSFKQSSPALRRGEMVLDLVASRGLREFLSQARL